MGKSISLKDLPVSCGTVADGVSSSVVTSIVVSGVVSVSAGVPVVSPVLSPSLVVKLPSSELVLVKTISVVELIVAVAIEVSVLVGTLLDCSSVMASVVVVRSSIVPSLAVRSCVEEGRFSVVVSSETVEISADGVFAIVLSVCEEWPVVVSVVMLLSVGILIAVVVSTVAEVVSFV